MKIFTRYLLLRLIQPFFICLSACTVIWMMADLYGNIDVFIDKRVGLPKILYFYSLQIPQMLVTILPATLLFSSLFTLLSLNRRSELVALQAGGIAPLRLYLPFLLFGGLMTLLLFVDMSGPAPWAQTTRQRILKQVKGDTAGKDDYTAMAYVDRTTNVVWFFQHLNTFSGVGEGVEILFRNEEGKDLVQYFARRAEWDAAHSFWRLRDCKVLQFTGVGPNETEEKILALKDLTDLNTPPIQLVFTASVPDELTLSQLSAYTSNDNMPEKQLAKYRTEWWQRIFHPFSLMILMMYALANGTTTDRRNAMGGVFNAIGVLLAYLCVMYVFLATGQANRFPPFLAAAATPLIFGGIGLYLLAKKNGWITSWRSLWDEAVAFFRAKTVEA